jgi:hypothetical protein
MARGYIYARIEIEVLSITLTSQVPGQENKDSND